jgi:hypothetical protein
MENKTDFDKLTRKITTIRLNIALLISDKLKAKEQEKFFNMLNELVNLEIEQEKLCNI